MDEWESIRQNLLDAGCNDTTIKRFLQCTDQRERMNILAIHRAELMDSYHRESKRIDCLDYLVRRLQKEN